MTVLHWKSSLHIYWWNSTEVMSNTFANGRILLPLSCSYEAIANVNPLNWNIGSETKHLKMFKNLSQLWNVIHLSGVKNNVQKEQAISDILSNRFHPVVVSFFSYFQYEFGIDNFFLLLVNHFSWYIYNVSIRFVKYFLPLLLTYMFSFCNDHDTFYCIVCKISFALAILVIYFSRLIFRNIIIFRSLFQTQFWPFSFWLLISTIKKNWRCLNIRKTAAF